MINRVLFMVMSIFFVPSFLVSHPKIGKPAPDFKLEDQDGNFHQLSDYKGKKLVIYFFVRANTPPCRKQACGLRDNFKEYEDSDIAILGVSYDPKMRLKSFKESNNIQFNFLSDLEKKVAKLYGVNRIFFPSRKTFLIDEKGILINKINSVNINKHAEEILAIFDSK